MKRNKFSLSNYKLLSCNLGSLVPCGAFEVLPGDSVQQATNMLIRMSPMLAPVMHPLHARVHHWFVPYRLIWEDWEDFITGGPDGLDASTYPLITGTIAAGTLGDYLGLPIMAGAEEFSALPFRAYALIWNEWYRDQDLQTALTVDIGSGADTTTNVTLQNVCWEKDYFTSARPWEQKGPAVTVPLGTTAPVTGLGILDGEAASGTDVNVWETDDATATAYSNQWSSSSGALRILAESAANPGAANTPQIYADLSNASAVTVNALREALAFQRYEEARARYGSRYVEYLRYLGVRSSDARLQRPEYLGGGKQTIQFSEVLQTAEGTNPVGELRGHGISAMRSNRYRRFFEEHGYVISCISVRPRTIYTQGLARTWNRRFKEDFWQSEFQHIGQQEVLNKELYAAHATPDGTFGYQDRYDEYRRTESSVAGEFRDTDLDHWHFARIFGSTPALNADFVKSVPAERPFAAASADVLYIMANHSIQARRLVAGVGRSWTF